VCTVLQDLMLNGSEFHLCGAVTEKAHHANSVRVLAADSSGASDDRRGRTGTAGWIRSFRYAGVDNESTLNVNVTILYVTCCFTGSQWNDQRSGLALVLPPC